MRRLVSAMAMSCLTLGALVSPMVANAATPGSTSYDKASSTTTLNTADKPTVDLDGAVVVKAMQNADQAGKPVGDIPLAGHKFRVSWYKNYYDSAEAAKSSGAPVMSAVWATKSDGSFSISKDRPVEGTWDSQDGSNVLPLGTLVIEEISVMEGVNKSDVPALAQVKLGSDGRAHVENTVGFSSKGVSGEIDSGPATLSPVDQGKEWMGSVSVVKLDKSFKSSENQGDSNLAGTQF